MRYTTSKHTPLQQYHRTPNHTTLTLHHNHTILTPLHPITLPYAILHFTTPHKATLNSPTTAQSWYIAASLSITLHQALCPAFVTKILLSLCLKINFITVTLVSYHDDLSSKISNFLSVHAICFSIKDSQQVIFLV